MRTMNKFNTILSKIQMQYNSLWNQSIKRIIDLGKKDVIEEAIIVPKRGIDNIYPLFEMEGNHRSYICFQ